MKVAEYRRTVNSASGAYNEETFNNVGGLLKYLLVRAATSNTSFQTTLTDHKSVVRKRYGFVTGELIDESMSIPITGAYTIGIVNGSQDDTFTIVFGVQE